MSYSVKITNEADNDLRSIYEYIAFELKSIETAIGQLERLEQSILKLSEMPERYKQYENEPWKSKGLRMMPVDNYIVFYISDNDKHTVTVIRVMYGGRNIERQL
ncbi:MAG: type II toxin-antitoxin system RelE/ParE family toxin [Ruminococcus sp.]|nr:type II toxin-antitoxin system RelE/ParE family toxin [Ruminococcus sp.]